MRHTNGTLDALQLDAYRDVHAGDKRTASSDDPRQDGRHALVEAPPNAMVRVWPGGGSDKAAPGRPSLAPAHAPSTHQAYRVLEVLKYGTSRLTLN